MVATKFAPGIKNVVLTKESITSEPTEATIAHHERYRRMLSVLDMIYPLSLSVKQFVHRLQKTYLFGRAISAAPLTYAETDEILVVFFIGQIQRAFQVCKHLRNAAAAVTETAQPLD